MSDMDGIRAAAKASKADKLEALDVKNTSPKVTPHGPSEAPLDTSVARGIPPTQDRPAFKSGGRVDGAAAKSRLDRPGRGAPKKKAMGGSAEDDSAAKKLAVNQAAASAVGDMTAPDPRKGYADGGSVEEEGVSGPDKNGMMTYNKPMAKMYRNPQGARAGYADGGAVKPKKGATTVNVIIAPQGGGAAAPPPMPMPPPSDAGPPPPAVVPPRPAAVMPPPGGLPNLPPGGLAPPMRKAGGRVNADYDAGAGSGLGRQEKIEHYGKNAGKKP